MSERGAFLRGFRAMMPLWLGVVPFGVAYDRTLIALGNHLHRWSHLLAAPEAATST